MPYVWRVSRCFTFMGQPLYAGDRLAILPGSYISILRDLPPDFGVAYGSILGADLAGDLEYVTPHRRLDPLALPAGLEPPPPSGSSPPGLPSPALAGHLRLV